MDKIEKNILIVDDEEDIRDVLCEYLVSCGYSTIEAENGEHAFDIFKKHKCDMVISDINMPKMNGLQLLKKLKAWNNSVPIILTTGYDLTKQEIKSLPDKPDAFVKKPFTLEYINYLVKALLK